MENKDLLVINENIIYKIINQIYLEQKNLFTKKNYLKAKAENRIALDFQDKLVDIILEINQDYVKDKDKFVEIIDFEIRNIVESSTTYLINKIDIVFDN